MGDCPNFRSTKMGLSPSDVPKSGRGESEFALHLFMQGLVVDIPMAARLAAIFLLGACAGSAINLAAYQLAWRPRAISPWWRRAADAPRRRWWDRLPVVGWLGLRREAGLHGRGFWVRPMAVELLMGLGLAWLYWWETAAGGLLPADFPRPFAQSLLAVLHSQYAVHVVLVCFMVAASLVDIDEKAIPDAITVPGTVLALLLAWLWPMSRLPDVVLGHGVFTVEAVTLTSPTPWPQELGPWPHVGPLALAIACFWAWCVALLPATWYPRHGRRRAVRLLAARLIRHPGTYAILATAVIGSLGIASAWYWAAPQGGLPRFAIAAPGAVLVYGSSWSALLSALVGMAAGGGLIWIVRIIGRLTLRKEAMGFGDVTLMAMIGAVLGWQPCLIIFFLAPVAGLVLGVVQLILVRDPEIPYGPFLCLAAVAAFVAWQPIWDWAWALFSLGWYVPLAVAVCMVVMAMLLGLWKFCVSHAGRGG